MAVHTEETHVFSMRTTRDGIDLFSDTYQLTQVQTNAQGQSFIFEAKGVSKDLKAEQLTDTLTQYTVIQNGQPFVIKESSGRVVNRDRGAVRFTFTFNSATGEFAFVGLTASGPHPGLGPEFCSLVAPLTGTDSASHHAARPLGSTDAGMGYDEYLPPSYDASGAKSPSSS